MQTELLLLHPIKFILSLPESWTSHLCCWGVICERGEWRRRTGNGICLRTQHQACTPLFVLENHTVPVLIHERIGNLEVTHFNWLLINSSYEGIQNSAQITLYLNYFRFQSINNSASFDTKALWLRLFIPTFMLCLLITLKFLFFFFKHRKAKKQSLKDIYIILYITSSFWEMRILKFQKYSHSKW